MSEQTICEEAQTIRSDALVERLRRLRAAVFDDAQKILTDYLPDTPKASWNSSIRNLAQYLALRRRDIRSIQDNLAETGVSSLGRCESHVMATLDQVIAVLQNGFRDPELCHCNEFGYPNYNEGRYLLERNAAHLFGPGDHARQTRIMVTLPTEAAFDDRLIHDLIARGMDCARINCAHDDHAVWQRMIEKIAAAEEAVGRDCRVLMDLAGQKVRTRPVPGLAKHICFKVSHKEGVLAPVSVRLVADQVEASLAENTLAIPPDIHACFSAGDRLFFEDARGKPRWLDVVGRSGEHDWIGACAKTAVLTAGMVVEHQRQNGQGGFKALRAFKVSAFPAVREERRLFVGDSLLLHRRDPEAGRTDDRAAIGCTHPEVVGQLSPGHAVWFDDGKIGARVVEVNDDYAELQVTDARPAGVRLRADKGINFPDLHLDLPCLTEKDLDDLDFICRHANMVGYSFVQSGEDMHALMDALDAREGRGLAIIAKIETRTAVKNLPEILFSALPRYRLGVMIARGDLAVELGGDRLAEIQEELLWLCEAAHVPVIWATQVLENLIRKGVSTRPELTDAAMSERAECVMLNKGPHVLKGVATLDSILTRMQDHQYKKVARMRALHW